MCRFALIAGDYGMGKSFMLDQIFRSATQRRGVLAIRDVLTEEPINTRVLLRKKPEFSIVNKIIENITRERLIQIWKDAKKQYKNSHFATLMDNLMVGEDSAWDFLIGEKLDKEGMTLLGLKGIKHSPEESLGKLFEILKIIRAGGYNSLVILVDEFEGIRSIPGPKGTVEFLDTLRTIFDEYGKIKDEAAKVIFIFGASGQAWDKITELEKSMEEKTGGGGIAPFLGRILPSDRITLTPFGIENTRELIGLRLKEVIPEDDRNPCHPFTEDAIKYIHSVSEKKPRLILQHCYMILEEFEKDSDARSIDLDFTSRILSKYNISPRE